MSFMSEIMEQPKVAMDLLGAFQTDEYKKNAEWLKKTMQEAAPAKFLFVGMGSSLFAGYIAVSLLTRAGIDARAMEAQEFIDFGTKLLDEHTIVIAISQSGRSMETVAACEQIKDFPRLAVVTNLPESNLAKYGKTAFLLHAGEEKHTATKSYTNTVVAVEYISAIITGADIPEFFGHVQKAAAYMSDMLSKDWSDIRDFWNGSTYTAMAGSGVSYCTASHAALVMMEAAHENVADYTVGQFIHGPIEIINEAFCTILYDFEPTVQESVDRVIEHTLNYGGRVILLTNRKNVPVRERMYVIDIPFEQDTVPMLEIIPMEMLTYLVGIQRGLHPGDLYRVHK